MRFKQHLGALPEDHAENLRTGDLLIGCGLEHDVEALDKSAFMLTIASPEVMHGA